MVTDISFGAPWDRHVKAQHYVAPTWSYLYDYMSNLSNSADWVGEFPVISDLSIGDGLIDLGMLVCLKDRSPR